MTGQMSIFDFLADVRPGDYVNADKLGRTLSFNDFGYAAGLFIGYLIDRRVRGND